MNDDKKIQAVLKWLVKEGIATKSGKGKATTYSLTNVGEMLGISLENLTIGDTPLN